MNLESGEYFVGGIPILSICKEFGTPLYLYEGERLLSQCKKLQVAFKSMNVKWRYALKACSNLSIIKLLRTADMGLDAVSIQEVNLGLLAGVPAKDIIFTPSCVAFDEIKEGVDAGVVVNIDSLSLLEKFGSYYGENGYCSIRFNPNIVAGGNAKIQVGHKHSKFGVPLVQLPEVKALVDKYKIKIIGVHVHTGSDILDIESFVESARVLFEIGVGFSDLQFIDFGSGFKVSYYDTDKSTDIDTLSTRLEADYRDFVRRYGRDVEIWFEPGKFIASAAGILLVNVNVVKPTPEVNFVGVNSGLNHLIRPMMYGSYHDIVNISNPSSERRKYTVVGNICETDTFGADRMLSEVREGDVLAIKNAGAYGFSMSSQYNSRYRPAEVLVYKNQAKLIRKREDFSDLLRNQIDVPL
ncbi:MAG: diaminopimelate decarboxylase [Deltaproteobacteria bacterium]|nr:diaminopimelate decarboxylase [Deltaproteobacteria bacterium]